MASNGRFLVLNNDGWPHEATRTRRGADKAAERIDQPTQIVEALPCPTCGTRGFWSCDRCGRGDT